LVERSTVRLPDCSHCGCGGQPVIDADGIAVRSAASDNAHGPIGSSIVTALADARRQVDVAKTRALGG